MMAQARRMDGYVRVSKVGTREGDSFISPQAQRERIEAAAKSARAEIVEWHTDLDQSGADASRPGFQAALARVEAGETDGIAVSKLDRFARSVLDAREALGRIDAAGATLISAEDGFDTKTPMGKFAATMIFALGELELERVRESWTTARTMAARRGVHMAKALTGYDHGEDGRLAPNDDAPAIQEVFRRRATGSNWTELGRFLDAEGVRPRGREEGGCWSAAAVKAIVRNRCYLGEIRAGDYVNTDAHLPLLTLAEWEAAQASRGSPITRASHGDASLLAGLLRCASCRYAMKRKRLGAGAKAHGVYRCARTHSAGTCPAPATIYASVIEPYIESLLLNEVADRTYRPETTTKALAKVEQEVAQARHELQAWVTEEELLSIGRDVYIEGLQARQRRLDEAEARRRALFSDDATALPPAAELTALWPTLTVDERRRLLAAVFDAIVVRPNGRRPVEERVVVLGRGDAPADLPGRGKRVPFKPFDLPGDAGVAFAQDRDDRRVEAA